MHFYACAQVYLYMCVKRSFLLRWVWICSIMDTCCKLLKTENLRLGNFKLNMKYSTTLNAVVDVPMLQYSPVLSRARRMCA